MADICQVEGCGEWLGRPNQKICADCKRKLKKAPLIKCKYPGCETLFPQGRNRSLCKQHTALPAQRCVHDTNPPEACEHCYRQAQNRARIEKERNEGTR